MPPPVVQPIENPQLYVWGGRLSEARATLPRGQGQKRITHQVDIYVHWVSDNSNMDLPVGIFPVFLDGIRGVLRAVQLPVQLTDDVTGEISQLTDFGENMNLAYTTPVTLADQRLLFNSGQIKVSAHEWINPA